MGHQLTIDLAFTYPSGNEQAVLRAKVNNDYGFTPGNGDSFARWRWLLTAEFLGNLQVSGDLDIPAGCYPVAFLLS